MPDQPQNDGRNEQARLLGVDQPEEREGHQTTQHCTAQIQRASTHAIGQRAKRRNEDDLDGGRDQDRIQHGLTRQFRDLGGVRQDENCEDVEEPFSAKRAPMTRRICLG